MSGEMHWERRLRGEPYDATLLAFGEHGVTLPLRDRGETVIDATGRAILQVDPDCVFARDEDVGAVAAWISVCVNTCAGYVAVPTAETEGVAS